MSRPLRVPRYWHQPRLLHDVLQWDVPAWRCALDLWSHVLPHAQGLRVLELGAAGGGVSLWWALRGAEVICSDVTSPAQHATCQALHKRYGVALTYLAVDARRLPFPDASLDVVCLKSVLGGLRKGGADPKPRVLAEIRRVLKPGGYLMTADNLAGHTLNMYLRQRFIPWAAGWEYFTRDAYLDLFVDFSVRYTTAGLTSVWGRSTGQRCWLGHVDEVVERLPFDKSQWHYVGAVAAQKPQN